VRSFSERLAGQVAGELALDRDRDPAGLLADDERDGVGLLGDADRRPVAGAHRLRERRVVREGQEAARGGDAVVLDDDRAVVEGRAGIEEGFEELAGEGGVEAAAVLDVLAQADVALDGDQGADAVLGELDGGVGELVDDAARLASQEGERMRVWARWERPRAELGANRTMMAMAEPERIQVSMRWMFSSLNCSARNRAPRKVTMKRKTMPFRMPAPGCRGPR
jgi:hypothetical protein